MYLMSIAELEPGTTGVQVHSSTNWVILIYKIICIQKDIKHVIVFSNSPKK